MPSAEDQDQDQDHGDDERLEDKCGAPADGRGGDAPISGPAAGSTLMSSDLVGWPFCRYRSIDAGCGARSPVSRVFDRGRSGDLRMTSDVQSVPVVLRNDSVACRGSDRRARVVDGDRRIGGAAWPATAVLPTPPDNQDKDSFVRRRMWILIPFSVLGFGCLAASQFRLAMSTPWIWLLLPLFLFTVVLLRRIACREPFQ